MAQKKFRVLSEQLIAGTPVKPNHVVEMDADSAKSYEKAGVLDGTKAAVDYALTINPEVIRIGAVEQPAAPLAPAGDENPNGE